MDEIKPGSIVTVTGYLHKSRYKDFTRLKPLTFATPRRALLLGTSTRMAGTLDSDEYGWNYMTSITETKRVWMAMPIMGNRYRTPLAVLPEHIVQIGDSNE